MEEEEIDPRVEQVNDLMLELIGEITKLSVLLRELPEEQYPALIERYSSLHLAIDSLPIKITEPHWGNNPAGEA